MALTEAQKEQLRIYTGRSLIDQDSDLERMLRVALRPTAEAAIAALLDDCAAVDAQIRDYILKLALAVQDGAIQIRAAYSLGVMQARGRMASNRLCQALSLTMGANDPWTAALPAPPQAG